MPDISLTVPSKSYFLLGDNRTRALDSRVLGPISTEQIEGVVTNTLDIDRRVKDQTRPYPCHIELEETSKSLRKGMAIDLDKTAPNMESLVKQINAILSQTKTGSKMMMALDKFIEKQPDFRIAPLTQELRATAKGFFPEETLQQLGGVYAPVFIEALTKKKLSVLAIDPALPVGIASIYFIHEAVHVLDTDFNAMARELTKQEGRGNINFVSERKAYDVANETMDELEAKFSCFKNLRQWANLHRQAITYRPSNRQIAKWYGLSVPGEN